AVPASAARSTNRTASAQPVNFMVSPFDRPSCATTCSECKALTAHPPQGLVAAAAAPVHQAVEQSMQSACVGAGLAVNRSGPFGAELVVAAGELDRRPLRHDGRERRRQPGELARPV